MSSSSSKGENTDVEKAWAAFQRLLRNFMRMEECQPFLQPVDWEALQLWDYPDIVEVPMDLGTVKKKLDEDGYKNVDEAADDVRRIWANCMLYNTEGSDFHRLAKRLESKFEDIFAEAYRAGEAPARRELDPDAVASVSARQLLTRNILRLSNAERGKLIRFVERHWPSAARRCPGEGDVLLNLDNLPQQGFHELSGYVKRRIAANRNNMVDRKRKLAA